MLPFCYLHSTSCSFLFNFFASPPLDLIPLDFEIKKGRISASQIVARRPDIYKKSSQRSRRPLGALKHGYCDRRWQSTDTLWRYYTRLPVEKQALSKSAASPSAEALHFPAGQVILNLSVSEPTGKVHRVSSVPSPCGDDGIFCFLCRFRQQSEQDRQLLALLAF